ncbi:M28 family peptidase [Novosphingobium sp. TH158]|uniref:M28 family peptidase n=1 Tax=Novosphingobium sp. TH158 TaxID=2067455 RepID=UPI000C7A83B1|nr:M28 family peptidase [Novosphingobium sp. TH158]PLK25882.1 peptidase M28 [Novosphingobium sp. TH158]
MSRVLTRTLLAASLIAVSPIALAQETASQARLKADVERLVGFGTRHTMSVQDHPTRGIGAARRWAEAEFRKTGAGCGNCLEIALPERMVSGDRVPVPTRLVNVVAIQRGIERPNEVVIVQAHIDSRVTDVMNATDDAPGANDDGSGTALVLEAARVLSKRKFPTTIVYAVLSGEEQGLLGGKLLADYAREQGWTVKAVLNNDIVGNTRGSDGLVDDKTVRVFSEGPRADGDDKLRASMRRFGGENDSPSRNLSRYVAGLSKPELAVRQIWRTDRMGRGGDHIPFLDSGVPAIRFSVGVENYDHQHQDLRTEKGKVYGDTIEFMDFPYLAKVTQLNIAALSRLAEAPMPPRLTIDGAVAVSTKLSWQSVNGAYSYNVYRRRTDERDWTLVSNVTASPSPPGGGSITATELNGVRADDWLFGVSSLSAQGSESPISSAVPGGQFAPLK